MPQSMSQSTAYHSQQHTIVNNMPQSTTHHQHATFNTIPVNSMPQSTTHCSQQYTTVNNTPPIYHSQQHATVNNTPPTYHSQQHATVNNTPPAHHSKKNTRHTLPKHHSQHDATVNNPDSMLWNKWLSQTRKHDKGLSRAQREVTSLST